MSNGIRFDRLEKLATFVEMGGIPGHVFNMGIWGNQALANGDHCGTAGCMAGLATLLWPNEIDIDRRDTSVLEVFHRSPDVGATAFDAMAALLGISAEESFQLFANTWRGEEQFDHKFHAQRLREFIERKRQEVEA